MLVRLIKVNKEAKDTKSFIWSTSDEIKYLPGQYFYFTLPRLIHPDARGPTRQFTLSSSPSEKGILMFTTRMRPQSGFKKSLDSLEIGDKIEAEGPNGTLILDENEIGDHVLLAGGIGTTPFRSIIKYNIDNKQKRIRLHLIYSTSIPEEITFKQEFVNWAKIFNNIKVDITITKPKKTKTSWNGLTGRIDEKMLQSLITYRRSSAKMKFWICGPPGMVTSIENLLFKLKVSESKIRSEKFTGY